MSPAFKLNGEDINSKDDANCMPVVMYYLGNSICAQLSRPNCLVHFVHLCIQLNCGGIILYIASTYYMYATITCLNDYFDYPNTAAHQLCLRRD